MRCVFHSLTPSGYTAVLTAVVIKFDYPKATVLVAPKVGAYTHECVVVALQAVPERLRTPLLSNVLPLCRDLSKNAARIRLKLIEQAVGGW